MRVSITDTLSRSVPAALIGGWVVVCAPAAVANVITDWDEKAIAVVFPTGPVAVSQQVYTSQRMMGMVHVAMFDAVNSIERRYSAAACGPSHVEGSRRSGGSRYGTGDS